jgi:hypothetical protein
MKDSGSTDDLASGNESGTEEKTSDHKVWVNSFSFPAVFRFNTGIGFAI